jgi:hypothetical protein
MTAGAERDFLGVAVRRAVAQPARALWAEGLLQPLHAMAKGRRVGRADGRDHSGHDGNIRMIDSNSVRAHQQAATATTSVQITVSSITRRPHEEGPRSCGCEGLSIRLGLSAGQAHDGQITDLLPNPGRPSSCLPTRL